MTITGADFMKISIEELIALEGNANKCKSCKKHLPHNGEVYLIEKREVDIDCYFDNISKLIEKQQYHFGTR